MVSRPDFEVFPLVTVSQVFVFDRIWMETFRLTAGLTRTVAGIGLATVVFFTPTVSVTEALCFAAAPTVR